MNENVYHIPALLNECIEGLNINPEGIYVDATFGGGGHSRAIGNNLGDKGHLYSFDQDQDAIANAIDDPRFTFVYSNFAYITNFMRFHGVKHADGILADLGVSFHHFDESDRGFSFRFDGTLDMRMNQEAEKTAADIINGYEIEDILRVLVRIIQLDTRCSTELGLHRERGLTDVDVADERFLLQLLHRIFHCFCESKIQLYKFRLLSFHAE